MVKSFEPLTPKVVLGVAAHPDDLEVIAAGSMARFVAEGAQAYYLILTNANKGTSDRSMQPDTLRDIRRDEQRQAAKILGLTDVFFAEFEDGCLSCDVDAKRDIVQIIRQVRPDVVITFDPTFIFSSEMGIINHADHRAAGQATLDAVYPLARDHLSFPELFKKGLEPHKVRTILMSNFETQNFYIDISDYLETKLAALRCHTSQFAEPDFVCNFVRSQAEKHGAKVGASHAEGFIRVDLS
jgi:LmbE family N-acetylglucosaminyl deacetylase